MSLSKQLLIFISLIFMVIFSVNFYLSLGNMKSYLEGESQIHVQDTATSLGLSLSTYMADEKDPIIRTMMNAIFDMGYYKEIRLENIDGDDLVVLQQSEKIGDVPHWLIDLMPMKTATAKSEINSGWTISGTVYVTSNPGYAYLKLYQQAKSTLKYSLLIFIAAIVLLVIALRIILQSLKAIEKQANEISSGNFTIISKLPSTLEIKNVAQSMNSMSQKIGDMISRLNKKVESLGDSLKRDPLTQLFNQASFDIGLKRALTTRNPGYAAYIKFDDLADIAKDKGNATVNNLLIDFADILRKAEKEGSIDAFRLFGSQFGLIFNGLDTTSVISFINELQQNIAKLAKKYAMEDLVHIGIIKFERDNDFDKLQPAMIEAYEQARNIGSNAYYLNDDIVSSMDDNQWKQLITAAIEQKTPEITLTSEAYDFSVPRQNVMSEAFTVVRGISGNPIAIGTFFSMAQEFKLESELDKVIINNVIDYIKAEFITSPVTINLSMTSLGSNAFRAWLADRLESIDIPTSLLTFSVTAYSAAKDLESLASFSLFVHKLGAKTLLKRYSSDIIAIDTLKELNIDYLRVARDLTTNIRANPNKAELLELINDVTNLLEIQLLAESVVDDADLDVLKDIGIDGVSR